MPTTPQDAALVVSLPTKRPSSDSPQGKLQPPPVKAKIDHTMGPLEQDPLNMGISKDAVVDDTTLADDINRQRVKEWLDTTVVGRRLCGNVLSFADQIREGQYQRESLARVTEWTPDQGRIITYKASMPPPLYALVFGNEGERVLREDDALKELLVKGDPIDFVLKSCVDPPPRPKPIMPTEAVLMEAFVRKFRGGSLNWMETGLQQYKKMYNPDTHYGRTIAVVQSSGTGKSRTMAEMAKKHFTVSVCFRELDKKQTEPKDGWPPRDDPACLFFSQTVPDLERKMSGSKISCFKGEEIAGAFLGGLLAIAVEKLKVSITPLNFVEEWGDASLSDDSAATRKDTFLAVQQHSKEALERHLEALLKLRDKIPSRSNTVRDASETSSAVGRGENARDLTTWYSAVHDLLVQPYANEVHSLCKKMHAEDFLFVFDECTQLNFNLRDDKPVGGLDKMSLLALQRMLKAGDRYNIWTFLLDTNSGIDHVQPVVGGVARSARLADDLRGLPVFPYMEFDVMLKGVPHPKTPMDALRLDHLKMYGRPYWSTLASDLVNAAIRKLICAREFRPQDEDHVFAVFAARLLLELGAGPAANKIASRSLCHHMRVLIGASNGVVSTCAPSEPMLAIAAASLLNMKGGVYAKALQFLVRTLILRGLVLERGMQGELLARILLMVARDRALVNGDTESAAMIVQQPLTQDLLDKGSWVQTVTLKEFLRTLLPGVDISYPETPNMLSWAENYQLNFTHFIQLTDVITQLSPGFLFYCWCRGVALQCAFRQPVFDILIVIYSGDLDQPFDEENLGLVTIQVKLRVATEPLCLLSDITCPTLCSNGKIWRPPHMVVLMELGTQQSFQQGGDYKIDFGTLSKNPRTVWEGYQNGEDKDKCLDEPHRYLLHIRGHQPYAIERMAPDIVALFRQHYDISPEEFDKIYTNMVKRLDPLARKAKGEFWSKGLFE